MDLSAYTAYQCINKISARLHAKIRIDTPASPSPSISFDQLLKGIAPEAFSTTPPECINNGGDIYIPNMSMPTHVESHSDKGIVTGAIWLKFAGLKLVPNSSPEQIEYTPNTASKFHEFLICLLDKIGECIFKLKEVKGFVKNAVDIKEKIKIMHTEGRMLFSCLKIVHELEHSGALWKHLRHPVMKKQIRNMLLPTTKQAPVPSVPVASRDNTKNDSEPRYKDAANASPQQEEKDFEEEIVDVLLPIPNENLDINYWAATISRWLSTLGVYYSALNRLMHFSNQKYSPLSSPMSSPEQCQPPPSVLSAVTSQEPPVLGGNIPIPFNFYKITTPRAVSYHQEPLEDTLEALIASQSLRMGKGSHGLQPHPTLTMERLKAYLISWANLRLQSSPSPHLPKILDWANWHTNFEGTRHCESCLGAILKIPYLPRSHPNMAELGPGVQQLLSLLKPPTGTASGLIGVSKQSCFTCALFVDCLNRYYESSPLGLSSLHALDDPSIDSNPTTKTNVDVQTRACHGSIYGYILPAASWVPLEVAKTMVQRLEIRLADAFMGIMNSVDEDERKKQLIEQANVRMREATIGSSSKQVAKVGMEVDSDSDSTLSSDLDLMAWEMFDYKPEE